MLNFFKKNKIVELTSPMTGKIIPIEEVPDKVFSDKMVGDGVAIEPVDGEIVSPIDGKVATIFPTNHAIGLITKEGLEILIHIGLDTVELNGLGFKRLTKKDAKVKKGDPLMEFDPKLVEEKGKSPITPIIITNMDKVKKMEKNTGDVERGNQIIMTIELI
ncbi:PTS system glucose-specific IIA component [Keratinibaculum paraultunense]|uniref:PTS system glucose-specific IIA component n=1 Tax=Keratinibaculum paraultunense TaxID=1278232 RepID=A0A4R3KYA8_9FIRM|nr:PTS glucose transporter subunit IIA [Keratinibaculum paraultunense]QQY78886.1 PTS glucose transporter subunit IIA [Keratinibaculum paraultunense]TCS90498.1 PTS system glucose-specific IIA component [Keratinibaculum paraultunense]